MRRQPQPSWEILDNLSMLRLEREGRQGRHLVQVKQAGVSWSPYIIRSVLFSSLFIYLHFHFRRLRDKRLIEISERERERETSYNKRDIKVVPIQTKLVGNDNSKEILLIKQSNHTSELREKQLINYTHYTYFITCTTGKFSKFEIESGLKAVITE